MQGNPAESVKKRKKCGFLAIFLEGAVTLHQGMGGISGAPAVQQVVEKPDRNAGSLSLTQDNL
jgi:hypothetical protein